MKIPFLKELKIALSITFLIASLLFMTSQFINAGVSGGGTSTSGSGDLKADGTVPLTADWDVGNFSITGRDLAADFGITGTTGTFTGALAGATINTGNGAVECYAQDQALRTTDDVTHSSLTVTNKATVGSLETAGTVTCGSLVASGAGASSTNDLTVTYGLTVGTGTITNGQVIHGTHWEKNFTISSPSQTYLVDGSSICIITKVPKAITITNLEVTADADPTTEISGSIKYVDTLIGLANPVIVNSIVTTNGALSDSSITSGSVAAGKCMIVVFDAQPDSAMKQLAFTLTGYYQ